MMPDITPKRGKDTVHLVRYLFGPGRFNEHSEQRIIAAADHLSGAVEGLRLDYRTQSEEIRQLGREMDSHRKALNKEVPKGHVWHCSISLPPEDSTDERKLTDAQWAEVAKAAMDKLGFDDGKKSPCRWIAVHHGKSLGGNEHIHLAVNLVREDGRLADTWNDRWKMQKLCAEFEVEFGLRVVEGRGKTHKPGVTRAELESSARAGRREPDRRWLARVVSGVATVAADEVEFVRRLRGAGVDVRPRYKTDPSGSENVVGYAVARGDAPEGEKIWFGGGKLDQDLSLPRLRARWGTHSRSFEAYQTWRPNSPLREETSPHRVDEWRSAAREAAEIGRYLRELPVGDEEQWRRVTRDVAGIMAIWSFRVEGTYPGAYAYAADALMDLSRSQYRRRPTRGALGFADLRDLALIVSSASRRGKNGQAQRALLRQVLHVIELIEEAERARGRAERAVERLAKARAQLQLVQGDRVLRLGTGAARTPQERGGSWIE